MRCIHLSYASRSTRLSRNRRWVRSQHPYIIQAFTPARPCVTDLTCASPKTSPSVVVRSATCLAPPSLLLRVEDNSTLNHTNYCTNYPLLRAPSQKIFAVWPLDFMIPKSRTLKYIWSCSRSSTFDPAEVPVHATLAVGHRDDSSTAPLVRLRNFPRRWARQPVGANFKPVLP